MVLPSFTSTFPGETGRGRRDEGKKQSLRFVNGIMMVSGGTGRGDRPGTAVGKVGKVLPPVKSMAPRVS